jgi:5-methylcytosine-specific restriction endonuclease McrA
MIAIAIVDSDAFLEMPSTTQNLYFHLNIRADDDGFVHNPKRIMRMIGASDDDMRVLLTKRYLLMFDSGVIVIKHWRIHNTIQKDRYKPTLYKEEMSQLKIKDSGAYTDTEGHEIKDVTKKPLTDAQRKRLEAKQESELPHSFEYKIKAKFLGELCPVCGETMGKKEYDDKTKMPTIQHNVPISKGGKHEINNISVICHSCNCSIQDKETPAYNSEIVKEKWQEILVLEFGSGMDPQVRLDQSSLDKISIEKDSKKPTKHKYGEYKNVLLTDDEYEKLSDKVNRDAMIKKLDEGIELKGYKYKSHYLAILKWAEKEPAVAEPKRKKTAVDFGGTK